MKRLFLLLLILPSFIFGQRLLAPESVIQTLVLTGAPSPESMNNNWVVYPLGDGTFIDFKTYPRKVPSKNYTDKAGKDFWDWHRSNMRHLHNKDNYVLDTSLGTLYIFVEKETQDLTALLMTTTHYIELAHYRLLDNQYLKPHKVWDSTIGLIVLDIMTQGK